MLESKISNLQWQLILGRINAGWCVPFLGAGVNVTCPGYEGLPLGSEVALRLMEKLAGFPDQGDFQRLARVEHHPRLEKYKDLTRVGLQDLARVSLRAVSEGDERNLMDLLKSIIPDQLRQPSRLLRTLAGLPKLQLIVTTNYDRLMERALEMLSYNEVRDVSGLVSKLRQSGNPSIAHLRERFSSEVNTILDDYDELKDLAKLRIRLEAGDVLSLYLGERLPPEMQQMLDEYNSPAVVDTLRSPRFEGLLPTSIENLLTNLDKPGYSYVDIQGTLIQQLQCLFQEELNRLVIDELNRLLVQDQPLYDPANFSDLVQPGNIPNSQDIRGVKSVRRNRQLLQHLFGDEIENVRNYEVVVQPIKGFSADALKDLQTKLSNPDTLVLYKMHGTFLEDDPESPLIITEENYIEFLTFIGGKGEGIHPMIKDKIVGSTLLFLGYGLEDWNFRTIFKGLIEKLPKNAQRTSFAVQKDPSEFWVNFWDKKSVRVFDMDLYEFSKQLDRRYQNLHRQSASGRSQ